MTQMIKLEIEAIIIAILANRLVVDVEFVTPNARLVADLSADSLNFLDIALDINDLLGIELLRGFGLYSKGGGSVSPCSSGNRSGRLT